MLVRLRPLLRYQNRLTETSIEEKNKKIGIFKKYAPYIHIKGGDKCWNSEF